MSISIQEMDQLLSLKPIERMNEFQLEHFIVENEPTHSAKMWRCLDELRSRRDSLVAIDMEIEGLKDSIKMSKLETEQQAKHIETLPEFAENYRITIRQKERQTVYLQNSLDKAHAKKVVIEEEAAYFYNKFKQLQAMAPYKDPSDPVAQAEYWNEKYTDELNMNVLLGRPLNTELIRCILCLKDDAPIKIQVKTMLEQIHKQAIERRKSLEIK